MENTQIEYPIIEFHILQSFPVTCLNRDDVGAPKSALVGGVSRARVSSQCWKRQVRLAMKAFGIKLAWRTKKVKSLLEEKCLELGATEAQAKACAGIIYKALFEGKSDGKTLLFISETELKALADFAKDNDFDETKIIKDEINKIKRRLNPAWDALDALDIALFGRMVAKTADMNVEAAASFSHAISTHKVTNEVEFFTALDDLPDEPGSAHMGSLEFNAATYYRYISLDLKQLAQTLNNSDTESLVEPLQKAIEAFTKALFVAVPSARQTTQSGASPWEFAKVLVRRGQRLQVPFETPVKPDQGGYLQPSIEALKDYLSKKEDLSGSLFGKRGDYEWGVERDYSIDNLIDDLKGHAAQS